VTLENVRQGVQTLQENALLADVIAAGKLKIVGGEYRARSGKVLTV
jgi:carbonic anhydrase